MINDQSIIASLAAEAFANYCSRCQAHPKVSEAYLQEALDSSGSWTSFEEDLEDMQVKWST